MNGFKHRRWQGWLFFASYCKSGCAGDNFFLANSSFKHFSGAYIGMSATGHGQTNSVPVDFDQCEYTGDNTFQTS